MLSHSIPWPVVGDRFCSSNPGCGVFFWQEAIIYNRKRAIGVSNQGWCNYFPLCSLYFLMCISEIAGVFVPVAVVATWGLLQSTVYWSHTAKALRSQAWHYLCLIWSSADGILKSTSKKNKEYWFLHELYIRRPNSRCNISGNCRQPAQKAYEKKTKEVIMVFWKLIGVFAR